MDRHMDWRQYGACLDEDPELFFPVGTTGPALVQTEDAKSVCRACPVRAECLRWALESGQESGVWGGTSEAERRALHRAAKPRRAASAAGRVQPRNSRRARVTASGCSSTR